MRTKQRPARCEGQLTQSHHAFAPIHGSAALRAAVSPADLAREISKDLSDVKVDFLRASSYGTASESSGNVQVKTTSDLGRWEEYHILLVSLALLVCWVSSAFAFVGNCSSSDKSAARAAAALAGWEEYHILLVSLAFSGSSASFLIQPG
jgi:hypothetical protein